MSTVSEFFLAYSPTGSLLLDALSVCGLSALACVAGLNIRDIRNHRQQAASKKAVRANVKETQVPVASTTNAGIVMQVELADMRDQYQRFSRESLVAVYAIKGNSIAQRKLEGGSISFVSSSDIAPQRREDLTQEYKALFEGFQRPVNDEWNWAGTGAGLLKIH